MRISLICAKPALAIRRCGALRLLMALRDTDQTGASTVAFEVLRRSGAARRQGGMVFMTHMNQSAINFAVLHNASFRCGTL
jgi:hypothetical protein